MCKSRAQTKTKSTRTKTKAIAKARIKTRAKAMEPNAIALKDLRIVLMPVHNVVVLNLGDPGLSDQLRRTELAMQRGRVAVAG